MNKIQIAATLLREVAKNTTDAAAFKVVVGKEKNEITLYPDEKRADCYCSGYTFFHAREVVDICRGLGLSFYIATFPIIEEGKRPYASYSVRIY